MLRLVSRAIQRRQRRWNSSSSRSNVIDALEDRGFIAALTSPALRVHVSAPSCIYSGVDPSASSLHVGNLLPLIGLLHFQAAGHQALAVIGGATGSIGDPSGRSSERQSLSQEELEQNVAGITAQVHRFFRNGMAYAAKRGGSFKGKERETDLDVGHEGGVKVLNNLDWFQGVSLLEFLRTVGKLARVSTMLAKDCVRSRLDSSDGISFTEFTYQLLQAHDFATLHRLHGCRIQLGGSDQWGNIVAGIDLIRRQKVARDAMPSQVAGKITKDTFESQRREPDQVEAAEGEAAFGLTIPLLTTSNGEKFGKSAGNAVWLDETRTSVSDFYQFFYRVTDEDVEKYLRMFTFLPVEEIRSIMANHWAEPSSRQAQTVLADEITELVHGPLAVRHARTAQTVLFRSDPRSLSPSDVLDAFRSDRRLISVPWSAINGIPITKLAVVHGLCRSRAEASRAVSSKSLFLNDVLIHDPRNEIHRSQLIKRHLAIIRWGHKNHLIFYVEDEVQSEQSQKSEYDLDWKARKAARSQERISPYQKAFAEGLIAEDEKEKAK